MNRIKGLMYGVISSSTFGLATLAGLGVFYAMTALLLTTLYLYS